MVYVLNNLGNPLMPTNRYAKTRILLKKSMARVVNTKPFTVQLLYDTENIVQPFDNYKFDTSKKETFNTVKEFKDSAVRDKQLKDIILNSGYKDVIQYSSIDDNDINSKKDIIKPSISANYSSDFYDEYQLSGILYGYDINKPQNDYPALTAIYNVLKTCTLNDNLTEEDFKNYINSTFIYSKYTYVFYMELEKSNVFDDNINLKYYNPFMNIKKIDNKLDVNTYLFNISYYDDAVSTIDFTMTFDVNVIAEGKTKV